MTKDINTAHTPLLELAECCEKATGPDRELDVAIFQAIGAPVPFQFANKLIALEFNDIENAYFARVSDDMQVRYSPPAYTASPDAAMTLVPEDWSVQVTHRSDGKGFVEAWHPAFVSMVETGMCASPALALCAAALRARVQS